MKTTVLFVDDHDYYRGAMCRLLQAEGYSTIEASDGRIAIEILDTVPDCVILDLMMPEVNGEEVLRHIRDQGIRTRVVAITAAGIGPMYDRVAAMKPEALLVKPMPWPDLLAAIGPPNREEIP